MEQFFTLFLQTNHLFTWSVIIFLICLLIYFFFNILSMINKKLKYKNVPLLIKDNFFQSLNYKLFSIHIVDIFVFDYDFTESDIFLKNQIVEILYQRKKQFFLYTGSYQIPHLLPNDFHQKKKIYQMKAKKIQKIKNKHHLHLLKTNKDAIQSHIRELSLFEKNEWLIQNQITV